MSNAEMQKFHEMTNSDMYFSRKLNISKKTEWQN